MGDEADEAVAEPEQRQGRAFTEVRKAIFRARGERHFIEALAGYLCVSLANNRRPRAKGLYGNNIKSRLRASRANFFRDDEIGGVFGVKDEENNIRT